jgi:ethanolamine utilization protein EutS
MAERNSINQVLNEIYGKAIERAGGTGQIRSVQVSTPGKEITFAHIIGSPDYTVFSNLGLDIGFHAGAHPSGSLGILSITPPENAIIAADIAVKAGDVDVGFMDRFSGTLIITGVRSSVDQAMYENLEFFRDVFGYRVCEISTQ